MKKNVMMLLIGALALTGAGCSEDDGTAECQASHNWRAETPGGVVCKGAPGCLCSGDQICSVTVVDRSSSPYTLSARCAALSEAADLAFTCDGPEDCGEGEVCCARLDDGGGSSCTPDKDCSGIGDERVLCRNDVHCTFPGHHCKPALAGTFFADLAGYCD